MREEELDEEPEKLDLRWEPVPTTLYVKRKGWKWEVLLRPVKAAPGSSARIQVHQTKPRAEAQKRRAVKRLKLVDPLGKWQFQVRAIKDTSGVWGLWVTYHGQMTPQEQQEQTIKSKQHSERMKAAFEHKRLRKLIQAQGQEPIIPRPRRR